MKKKPAKKRPTKQTRAKKPPGTSKPHLVLRRSIMLPKGESVDIKYWGEPGRIHVAAFNPAGKQVTATTYGADVETASDFYTVLSEHAIDALAQVIESDLLANPDLHYRP